jgi:outer membrane immunogenic protein
LVALTLPAGAADLAARPYIKAPVAAAVALYDWSGFYIGINGGGGSSHTCRNLVINDDGVPAGNAPEGCHDATGGTAGGQVGYRWQFTNWVFGLEAQGNWANFSGSNLSLFDTTQRAHSRVDAFGLFTGQVGYAWNNVLLYAKGGAAVAADKFEDLAVANNLVLSSAKETRWGAAVGAGLEYGFAPNWSVGVEYDHLFMGSRDLNFTQVGTGAFAGTVAVKQDIDIGLVRVNYRFGGPVIAKY